MINKEKLTNIVVKAIKNPSFALEMMSNTHSVLKSEGILLPDDVVLRVVQDTAKEKYLVLPQSAVASELNENELEAVAGGKKSSGVAKNVEKLGKDVVGEAKQVEGAISRILNGSWF